MSKLDRPEGSTPDPDPAPDPIEELFLLLDGIRNSADAASGDLSASILKLKQLLDRFPPPHPGRLQTREEKRLYAFVAELRQALKTVKTAHKKVEKAARRAFQAKGLVESLADPDIREVEIDSNSGYPEIHSFRLLRTVDGKRKERAWYYIRIDGTTYKFPGVVGATLLVLAGDDLPSDDRWVSFKRKEDIAKALGKDEAEVSRLAHRAKNYPVEKYQFPEDIFEHRDGEGYRIRLVSEAMSDPDDDDSASL